MSRSAPTKIEAVLLYYAIGQIDEPSELGEWLASFSRECLVGRVRVSREGVNATLGGPMAALEAHMLRARRERRDVFAETEFNLTRVGDEETARVRDASLRRETGFDAYRWRVVEEIVTFGRAPATKATSIRRLKRDAWDAALAKPESVVIDVRNGYESAIGRFEGAATVLAPDIRSTSDFASWLESAPIPDGAPVLAYCTGGVRCERAAELIAARTNSAEVAMLDGGVVRYLEQVERDGDDGLFCGRLFVFDPRVSVRARKPVGSETAAAASACAACGSGPVHDYCSDRRTRRARCETCRLLLLVCDRCSTTTGGETGRRRRPLACTSCAARRR
ncbi:hypothetical protein CTAYLR_004775 [Chrysophaeum taylorii]|uniref:Rhodanese domain-containing protein n=1 Tax=Chrysophaeum taylorii TaxID=2483200 RepID=A0AAD7XN01_9STRA|nr:hypothetical protein CTAYLR_004775 [Chrysophaeum taylorii]